MRVHPLLAALRRHKVAVSLMVLQIALTLGIVSNATLIIGQRIERVNRPTGLDENDLIRISQQWPGTANSDNASSIERRDALQQADLDMLRKLPDVQSVAASTSIPLRGALTTGHLTLTANQQGISVHAAYYYGDQYLRSTLGLHLIAGRDFHAGEILHGLARPDSPVIIVSKPVADQLFPDGNALGQTVYQDGKLSTIVGVVERLQASTVWKGNDSWAYNSVLEPVRADGSYVGYVVRARPGREQAVLRDVRKELFALNPMRIMSDTWGGIHPFSEIRARAYRSDRGMALLMSVVCVILLCITAAGIVGLTSFWVGQRYRQIGVRRALGARRIDILRYFQVENLLIAGGGAAFGVLFAFSLNGLMMRHYEIARLPISNVVIGVLAILALSQAAVLVPALRASNVPPIVATRSI